MTAVRLAQTRLTNTCDLMQRLFHLGDNRLFIWPNILLSNGRYGSSETTPAIFAQSFGGSIERHLSGVGPWTVPVR